MYAPPPPPQQKSNNNVLWIVLGMLAVCGIGGVGIMAAILFPVFSQAKLAAKKTQALSNVKQLGLAINIYASDNNDRMPIADRWMDAVESYARQERIFRSPEATPEDPTDYGFAFRKEFGQKKMIDYPDAATRAMVFDSTILSRNATSGLETVPNPGRYGTSSTRGNMIGFMDGHAKFYTDEAYLKQRALGSKELR